MADTTPPSTKETRATQHALVNGSALLAFGLGWLFRDATTLEPGWGTLALEGVAGLLITWGGWLGGTLVYRNQIGVDHRYAHAAKWKERAVDGRPGEVVAVAKSDELKIGQMKLLHVGGRRVVLARTEEGYVAFDDRCTHRGGSLADGVLICGTVACPWHGSQFDARTGAAKAGPAEQPITTYPVELASDDVRLRLPAAQE